ncbi:hypothetical protein C8F04DRAFT_1398794 [Mycena alexandri]|uniref:XPG-I domain-containing protein n=1 Tax=Mycena alexandri TaxID=1745969 RepID=A0AAD6SJL1_9AGAR|nr:hypothetical protein C8F04DRAFT_1398794 [Mycena alexandri]
MDPRPLFLLGLPLCHGAFILDLDYDMSSTKLWPHLLLRSMTSFSLLSGGGFPKLNGVNASIWIHQVSNSLKEDGTIKGPIPQLQALLSRLTQFLAMPMKAIFVFNKTEQGSRGHQLITPFRALIEVFGYSWYTAPGLADAELARLESTGIIQFVTTANIDAFIFGARNVMLPYAYNLYVPSLTSHPIFLSPQMSASVVGACYCLHSLLEGIIIRVFLVAVYASLTRLPGGPLGDDLLHEVLQHSERLRVFCQHQFRWKAAQISDHFSKHLYSGIAMQSLLKPHDLHTPLESHVNFGVSHDGELPSSSILRIVAAKRTPVTKIYQLEISTGTLALRAKSGLRDASAFPVVALMRVWIPPR